MSAVAMARGKRIDWRRIGFLLVLGLILLFRAFEGLLSLAAPWVPDTSVTPGYTNEIHIWHEAVHGVVSGLLAGLALLGLVRRPQNRPLLMQFLFIMLVGSELIQLVQVLRGRTGNIPFMIIELVIYGLMVLFYPAPKELLRFTREGPWSKPLLRLSLLAALFLVPDIYRNLQLQLGGMGAEHLTFNHWLWNAWMDFLLIIGGVLAASRRPGWTWLGMQVGIVFLYLGPAAAATLNQEGSLGMTGGIISALLGTAFVGTVIYEARKSRSESYPFVVDNFDL